MLNAAPVAQQLLALGEARLEPSRDQARPPKGRPKPCRAGRTGWPQDEWHCQTRGDSWIRVPHLLREPGRRPRRSAHHRTCKNAVRPRRRTRSPIPSRTELEDSPRNLVLGITRQAAGSRRSPATHERCGVGARDLAREGAHPAQSCSSWTRGSPSRPEEQQALEEALGHEGKIAAVQGPTPSAANM